MVLAIVFMSASQASAMCWWTNTCPPPNWPAVYGPTLGASTVAQPCNLTGEFDVAFAAKFGLLSFDWNNWKYGAGGWLDASPHTCEELLIKQCADVKAAAKAAGAAHVPRCFAYRNTELALQWMTTQAAVMDAEHAAQHWFMQFQSDSNSTAAAKCAAAGPCDPSRKPEYCCAFGSVYAEPQTASPGVPDMFQFFWNFSTPAAAAYFRDRVMVGGATASPALDGVFSDDVSGFPVEHELAAARMGVTRAEAELLNTALGEAWQSSINGLVEAGKYNWQAFQGGNDDSTAGAPSAAGEATCAAPMRAWCAEQGKGGALLLTADGSNTTAAAFLVARSDHWFLGTGWSNCGLRQSWYPQYDWRVGEPVSGCEEIKPGVFTRAFRPDGAGAVKQATLDCNAFTAEIDFS